MVSAGRAGLSGGGRRACCEGNVVKEPVAVLHQVPDDGDVDDQDDENTGREVAHQVVDLDGDKKGRLTDGQPGGPEDPEHHSNALHQEQAAVEQSSGSYPTQRRRRDGLEL